LSAAFSTVLARAFSVARSHTQGITAASATFHVLWMLSLILWSNTADVFANSVSISIGYALSGSLMLPIWNRKPPNPIAASKIHVNWV
jgi:hypothetical protein